ncbi:putative membrane protein [Neisseria sp. HSC-16F19]|nr:DUF1304 domain-containing protein [Neisseria sp. HSC-16F19]MCP2040729.1 putative membrane protein [Neisseria sp. HSC-16F19]
MLILSLIFIALSALLHIYICVLEMFLWDQPQGRRTFGLSAEFAAATKELAANQGFYNLLLALIMLAGIAGVLADTAWGTALCMAGAASTVAAGVYLGATSPNKRKPAAIQLAPGLIGLVLLGLHYL